MRSHDPATFHSARADCPDLLRGVDAAVLVAIDHQQEVPVGGDVMGVPLHVLPVVTIGTNGIVLQIEVLGRGGGLFH